MGLLDGKVAIVTGAGRGVGKSEALGLAKEGASVIVNDLGVNLDGSGGERKVADQVVQEIKDAGGNSAPNYSDIGTLEGAESVTWTALSKYGRLDIMVNNAGILRDRTILNMSEDDWDSVQKVHTKGTFLCTRTAARIMKTRGEGGVIINTTSSSGLLGNFGQSNYGHAKAGIYGFTKVAAMELGRYGIRVHAVCPNALTRMTSSVSGRGNVTEDMITPDAIVPLVIYLCSDLSKDLNGRIIGAQGGINSKSALYEFKMTRAEPFIKEGGLFTVEEIAENINKALVPQPDLGIFSILRSE